LKNPQSSASRPEAYGKIEALGKIGYHGILRKSKKH